MNVRLVWMLYCRVPDRGMSGARTWAGSMTSPVRMSRAARSAFAGLVSSAALPVGLALLEEGAHALLEVLAQVARQDDVLGITECSGARDPPRGLFHGGQRQRRQLGQVPGQLGDPAEKLLTRM